MFPEGFDAGGWLPVGLDCVPVVAPGLLEGEPGFWAPGFWSGAPVVLGEGVAAVPVEEPVSGVAGVAEFSASGVWGAVFCGVGAPGAGAAVCGVGAAVCGVGAAVCGVGIALLGTWFCVGPGDGLGEPVFWATT